MALYKRGGTYYADLTDPRLGRIRESLRTGDEKLARVRHAELEVALHRGTYAPQRAARATRSGTPAGSISLGQAYDLACRGRWMLDAAPSTRKAAESHARRLWTVLPESTPVAQVDEAAAERVQTELRRRGLSPVSINATLWVLRAALEAARKAGALDALPPMPRALSVGDNTRVRVLSQAEEEAILALLATDDTRAELRDVVVLLLATGARLGEILDLRAEEVSLPSRRLTFARTKTRRPRTLPMTERAAAVLERRMAGKAGAARLFSGPLPAAIARVEVAWRAVREELALHDVVLHSFRHTVGTRLMAAGVDLRTAMEWLGHTTPVQTLRYAKATAEGLRQAAALLDGSAQSRHNPLEIKS